MALSPLTDNDRIVVTESPTVEPTKTYRLGESEIGGLIDGEESLRQFVQKAVRTARFRFLIYDDEYGSELDDLIGEDISAELLQTEIPRVVTEALIYDDRISDVTDYDITREGDKVYVAFTVVTTDGSTITEEVAI